MYLIGKTFHVFENSFANEEIYLDDLIYFLENKKKCRAKFYEINIPEGLILNFTQISQKFLQMIVEKSESSFSDSFLNV